MCTRGLPNRAASPIGSRSSFLLLLVASRAARARPCSRIRPCLPAQPRLPRRHCRPQARGGCACAGPYAQALLGLDAATAKRVEGELLERRELLRPGFTRVSFPYFVSEAELQYALRAIALVAAHGQRFLPLYRFNHKSGEWQHHSRFTKFPGRLWLSNIDFRPRAVAAGAGANAPHRSAAEQKVKVRDDALLATMAEIEATFFQKKSDKTLRRLIKFAGSSKLPDQSVLLDQVLCPLRSALRAVPCAP